MLRDRSKIYMLGNCVRCTCDFIGLKYVGSIQITKIIFSVVTYFLTVFTDKSRALDRYWLTLQVFATSSRVNVTQKRDGHIVDSSSYSSSHLKNKVGILYSSDLPAVLHICRNTRDATQLGTLYIKAYKQLPSADQQQTAYQLLG